MTLRKLFFLLLSLGVLYGAEYDYADDLTPDEAVALIQKEHALLVDVRDPMEYLYASHAVGALNIPVFFVRPTLPPLKQRQLLADKERQNQKAYHQKKSYKPAMTPNKRFVEEVRKALNGHMEHPVIVICRSGERSAFAADKLTKNGFENVYNLDGGMLAWEKDGLPAGGK
ncbi:MAG: rhodanese-like domain-containing protein [Epsilonproteobacteria bacterium]|nr:rhodanese-like domain-containing protein [Campylobacterota bacterium]